MTDEMTPSCPACGEPTDSGCCDSTCTRIHFAQKDTRINTGDLVFDNSFTGSCQSLEKYLHSIARYADMNRPDSPIIDEFVEAHSGLINRFAERVYRGEK